MAVMTALGLGLAAAGAIASSSAQKSAANKAADTSMQVAQENNALARDIYGQNKAALSPYMQRGNVAGDYMNAMLGLPSNSAATVQAPTQYGDFGSAQGFAGNDIYASPYLNTGNPRAYGNFGNSSTSGYNFNPYGNGNTPSSGNVGQMGTYGQGGAQGVSQADAQNAFGSYIKNSDYGFQFANGSNAVNSGYAGAGTLQSGAAMKAMEKYRQNLQSGYRTEYMNALGNQQGTGLSGASALAGVGQNYVNTISANNNSAGSAAANAALANGNNSFGNVLGLIGGGLYGYGR